MDLGFDPLGQGKDSGAVRAGRIWVWVQFQQLGPRLLGFRATSCRGRLAFHYLELPCLWNSGLAFISKQDT